MKNILPVCLCCILALVGCFSSPEEKVAVRKARAQQYVESGNYEEALVELNGALSISPDDPDLLFEIGKAYEHKGDLKRAHGAFVRVTELDPANLPARIRLGNLYLIVKSPEKAKDCARQVLDQDPNLAGGYVLMGGGYLLEGNAEEAVKAFKEAIRLEPDNPSHRLLLAKTLFNADHLDQARKELDEILALNPADGGALLYLAQIADRQGQPETVEDAFRRLLDATPDNVGAWLSYGNYLVEKGRLEEALQSYYQAAQRQPNSRLAWERIAELALSQNNYKMVREAIDGLLSDGKMQVTVKYFQGRLALEEKRFGEAEALLRDVVKDRPNNADSLFYFGFASFLNGNPRAALEQLAKSLEIRPGHYKTQMLLAQVEYSLKHYPRVLKLTEPLINAPNVHSESILIRSRALMALGRYGEAAQILEKTTTAAPKLVPAHELLGLCYVAQREPEKAIGAFERCMAADPKNLTCLVRLTAVLAAKGQAERAILRTRQYIDTQGDSAEVRQLLGRLYMEKEAPDKARVELERAVEMDPSAPENYALLAHLSRGPNAVREAITDLDRALEQNPAYGKAWMSKGILHDLLGESGLAEQSYRQVLEIDPNFVPGLNNLASNLVEGNGNLDEALKFAERAMEIAPDSAAVNDTLGWIYVKKGVFLKALSHLKAASKAMPNDPVVSYHLAEAYVGAGEVKEAVTALERALVVEQFPHSQRARALLEELQAKEEEVPNSNPGR